MSSQHNEFPELTVEAIAAYREAFPHAVDPDHDNRRYLRAFLLEAMKQAEKGYGAPLWDRLEDIAANLHNPPPPPPTLAQMEQALQNLLRHTDDPAGCHEGSVVAESADILQRGIAHHCKVQP